MRTSQTRATARSTAPEQSKQLKKEPAQSAAILQMQKAFGNRATMQYLQSRSTAKPIQRDLESEEYNTDNEDNIKSAKTFFANYNTAVQRAYEYVLSVPSLGAYANLDGYTQLWITKWNKYLNNEKVDLMAATFGYVIESLVSTDGSTFVPSPPANCTVLTQVTYGGTRPDLVLRPTTGGGDIAWLDLTASNSAEHIYDKEGWRDKVEIFAEATYPSLNPGSLSFMKQNKDNLGTLDQEEVKKRLAIAQEAYRVRKAEWLELGQNFTYTTLKDEVAKVKPLPVQKLDARVRQNFIHQHLMEYFGAELGIKMVPSVLTALGVDPKGWHFTTGFSVSESAGESWLVDHPLAVETEDTEMKTEE
ncbi:hypothetical protein CBW65_23600 [Tumebacillus avium]|uniref:Uncharacterized protein n=1 Tax=Tumebacillus avium TaxID=1903704 RepID=A0A1Y0ITN5_9BACL|nr:hypothetical protein [Tumebacillus avium]ARU63670.1 hypothetical protein CBW65_23600 [Tumebacillus avium]